MRQQLPAGPGAEGAGRLSRFRRFVTSTWRGRVLGGALAVWLANGLLALFGLGLFEPVVVIARVVLVVALGFMLLRGLRWLSDRLLWRIRTKLILSYLFVALVPLVLLASSS